MRGADGRQLWADIVRLTDASGDEYIRSLRIVLFVLLKSSGADPFLRQCRNILSGFQSLIPCRRIPIPQIRGGRLLFCFAHRTSSNMQNLLPVAREAHRRGLLGGIVTVANFSKELEEFVGQVPITTAAALKSQLSSGDQRQMCVEAFRVCRDIYVILSEYDASLSASFLKNIGTVLFHALTSLQMARAFESLLDAWLPCGVVSTSDLYPLEWQLAHQASCKQIPSVVIQHGNLTYFYWPFVGGLNVVWGKEAFDEMVGLGSPRHRLVLGGMPASDRLFGRKTAVPEKRQATSTRPLCLILSHTHARDMEKELWDNYKRFLSKLILTTPFVRWKVKLHPSEDRSFYDDLEPEAAAKLEFHPRSTPLEDALDEADVVTTLYSTSGLEAMIAERPLIIPIVSPRMTEPGFPRIQGAILVHSSEEFKLELWEVIANPEHRARQLASQKQALRYAFSNQGHASEAIMDIISERFYSTAAPCQPFERAQSI